MPRRLLLFWAIIALPLLAAVPSNATVLFAAIPSAIPPAETGDYHAIHTIAVISGIGSELRVSNGGLFGVGDKSVDITNWGIDDRVTAMMRQYLGSRFSIVDTPYDRGAVNALPNGVWENSSGRMNAILRGIGRSDVDAYLIIRPDLEYSAPGAAGLAIFPGSTGMLGYAGSMWANYEIDLVDAKTFKEVAKSYSRVQERAGAEQGFAGFFLPDELRLADPLALTADQNDLLKLVTIRLLNNSIVETLRTLEFGVALPEPGARVLRPLKPEETPFRNIKTVAVVSAVGDQLDLNHLGGTVFSESSEPYPIAGWNLDGDIEANLRNAVAARFTTKTVPFDRTALFGTRIRDDDGKWADKMTGLPPSNDVDAYIVVLKQRMTLWGVRKGIGSVLFTHRLGDTVEAHANYAIALVDARTLEILEAQDLMPGPDLPTEHPALPLDQALWMEKAQEVTPDKAESLHAAFKKLLAIVLPETAMRMLLTGVIPSTDPAPSLQTSAP